MILKSIEEEAADCRAAWAAVPGATAGLHIHHDTVMEPLRETIENRIAYIQRHKPKEEQAIRLRAMRPISAQVWLEYQRIERPALEEYERITQPALAEYKRIKQPAWEEYLRITQPAWAEYLRIMREVHDAYCTADCPWDGRTLFPKEGQ